MAGKHGGIVLMASEVGGQSAQIMVSFWNCSLPAVCSTVADRFERVHGVKACPARNIRVFRGPLFISVEVLFWEQQWGSLNLKLYHGSL